MPERVKIGFFLDAEVMTKFRNLIQQKYKKYEKGLLSYEAEMAFRHWIGIHTNAQSSLDQNVPNPTPKVYLVFAETKNYLLHKYYEELKSGQQIPSKFVKEAIMAVRGSDKRTIERWTRVFHQMGLIKFTSSATWEIF